MLFNGTSDEYLLYTRGPKHLPDLTIYLNMVFYLFIFVTGLFGNVSVCFVIYKNRSLHTPTNFYLFSLSISDIALVLSGLMYDVSLCWQMYPWMYDVKTCKLRALVSELMSYSSVLTVVAFTTERFLAICHPLSLSTMSGFKRTLPVILLCYLVAFICALPFALLSTVNYMDFPPGSGKKLLDSAFCAMLEVPKWPLYELSFAIFFLIPLIIIITLYAQIGNTLRRRAATSVAGSADGTIHGDMRTNQVIRLLVAIVVTFFICWLPYHVQRLLFVHAQNMPYYLEINQYLYLISGPLYYVSAIANPILNNVMSSRYRRAFCETFFCSRSFAPVTTLPIDSRSRSPRARPNFDAELAPTSAVNTNLIAIHSDPSIPNEAETQL